MKAWGVAFVFAVLSLGVASAQSNNDPKKRALPDFDARELNSSGDRSLDQNAAVATVLERRRSAIQSFLRTPEERDFGARIVTNQYGLPKLYQRDRRPLTGASASPRAEIARNFLRTRSDLFLLTEPEIEALRLLVDDVNSNAEFLAFNQTVNGVDVFNAQIKFTLNREGSIVQVSAANIVPALNLGTTAGLRADDAVAAAFTAVGAKSINSLSRGSTTGNKTTFDNPLGRELTPISAELAVFPINAISARLAYRIFIEVDRKSWYELVVDANSGELLFRHNLYVFSGQARVWMDSPAVGSRALIPLPDGWLPTNGSVTTGNNVDAYIDANGDDLPDSVANINLKNGRAYSGTGVFDFQFNDGSTRQDPRYYQPASVTNLFYFVNIAHDYYYKLGFTEAAGNFQTDNFGLGGAGNDAVRAEAQFGGFTDNAAFTPTPDGVSPKIQLGLFTRGTIATTDDLDSDYEGQIVIHEYGHGVSNRLVGAKTSTSCLANIQSGAMGEGWSDYFAISYFNNPVHGAYTSQNFTRGARRYSYEGYPLTYEDIGTGGYGYEVHDDGEIWAGTLWDLRKTLGASATDKLVIDGLKSTPCNPSMTDGRDAILAADQVDNNGANRSVIWTVFARHGMGYSALGIDGTLQTGTRYDAAYDLPPDLQKTRNPAITSNPLPIRTGAGNSYQYTVSASNPSGGNLSYVLSKGPTNMIVDSASGLVTWSAGFVGPRVKITVTDGLGGKVVHGYALPVVTQLKDGIPNYISGDQYSIGYATIVVPPDTPVLQVTMRGGDGDVDLWVKDPDGQYSQSIRSGSTETLSFPSPKSGQWQIEGRGISNYSAVQLSAALITPTLLSANTRLSGLSAALSSETFFHVVVPPGGNSLTISTTGPDLIPTPSGWFVQGDVDLFLRKGTSAACQLPDVAVTSCLYDQVSAFLGNDENITVNNPAPGDWYIDLLASAAYSQVTLALSMSFPPMNVLEGGAVQTSTPGRGDAINAGYATATLANGTAPFATAVYSLSQNGVVTSEAGIPASPPTPNARIFVDYRTGVSAGIGKLDIRTGLAMANPGASVANLTYTLRDAGGLVIATGHGTLPPGAHRAKFLDELSSIAPDFNLPADFSTKELYGSLEITSSVPVSALALRLTNNQQGDTLLTSTPIADLTRPQTTSTVYFPQLANGGGFVTSLVLLNTSLSTETGQISFFNDDGSPLSLRSVTGAAGSNFPYSIPPSGFFIFQTDGAPPSTQVGWARVAPDAGSNAPVGAGLFSYSPAGILVTESGVPSAVPTTRARVYIDTTNKHDTGIAIVNPGSTVASLSVRAFQLDGVSGIGNPATLSLPAKGHKAAFAGEFIPSLTIGNTSIAEISSASPFVALTLRSLTNSRGDVLLTTFPIADTTQPAPSPIVFPQIADGAGFATQFIFIGANGQATVSVDFFGDDGSSLMLGRIQ